MTAERDRLLTVSEIASLLQVPMKTVYYWIGRNEIPYIKVGRHLRFEAPKVLAHFAQRTEERKPACFRQGGLLQVPPSIRSMTKSAALPTSRKEQGNGNN